MPVLILLTFFRLSATAEAACPAGEDQMQLLHRAEGTDSDISLHTVDTFNIPAGTLAIGDILKTYISVQTQSGTGGNWFLFSPSNNVNIGATKAANSSAVTDTLARGTSNTALYWYSSPQDTGTATITSWSGAWSIGLRFSAGVTRVVNWNYSVFKINGTGDCIGASPSAGATTSASDTEAIMNIDAEQRTLVYVSILALALAAFNSAAFWAWRIVKGTKKEI